MSKGFQIQLLSKYRNVLMGIAIMGILFCHYGECRVLHDLPQNPASKILALGNSFVDVFLILSGIGLYYSYSKNYTVIQFYKRRFLRLMPAYFIIAFPYWLYKDVFIEGGSLKEVLYDFLFISFVSKGIQRFWFVFLIGILYLLFPFVYKYYEKFKGKNIMFLVLILIILICGIILKLFVPDLFANIDIAFERIPIFIIGVYFGIKCKENSYFMWQKIFALFGLTIAIKYLSTIEMFGLLHDFFNYYIVSLQGLCVVIILAALIEKCNGYKFLNPIRDMFSNFGTVTLEAYLLHSAFKNLANYPSNFIMYCIIVVILPIVFAYIIHFFCSKVIHA